jgi:hypothetical protein
MAVPPGSQAPSYIVTRVQGGLQFEAILTWNNSVEGWEYSFETSPDLITWAPLTVTPTILASDNMKKTLRYRFTLPDIAATTVRLNIVPAGQ